MASHDVVFLTGLPSLLAKNVCLEVLRDDPQAHVHAIVRAPQLEAARAAVDGWPAPSRARVDLIEGDPSAIDMGLSGSEFGAIAREVTRIHVCADVKHPGVDLKAAERVNLRGAEEAIELATSCDRLEGLVYYSTAHVSGDRVGRVLEEDLKAGQSFRNVVEETKARAEKLMRGAMSRLPVVVLRPATIVGDSRTGEVDRFDGPYLLIMLVVSSPPDLALPLPGRGDDPLNLVPIDWVARAAVAIGRDARATGRTFHLVDDNPLTTREVFELVARAGGRRGPRGSIPANLAKALLRAPGLDRIAKSPRAFLETLTTPVTYDARHASELLAPLGIGPCPPLESYVERLVEFVQERVRRRKETKKTAVEVEDPLV
ncbi:MAG TPA: SDR family oxidoreductase [Polyangiaceae bacterium]|nr:SDR family oxidoreductase [Polyangiaceae bacterium]